MRVLEPPRPEPTFAQRAEARGRKIAGQPENRSDQDSPLATLSREIALTLDQIDGARRVHEQVRRSLLRQECYLDTEILQREPRPPVYDDPRLPERDRLRDRLRAVEKERRQLLVAEEEQLRPLHDRLLVLLNRHELLRY